MSLSAVSLGFLNTSRSISILEMEQILLHVLNVLEKLEECREKEKVYRISIGLMDLIWVPLNSFSFRTFCLALIERNSYLDFCFKKRMGRKL